MEVPIGLGPKITPHFVDLPVTENFKRFLERFFFLQNDSSLVGRDCKLFWSLEGLTWHYEILTESVFRRDPVVDLGFDRGRGNTMANNIIMQSCPD